MLNKLLTFPMFELNDHVEYLLETFPVESRMQPSKAAIRLQGPLSMYSQFNWGKVCWWVMVSMVIDGLLVWWLGILL